MLWAQMTHSKMSLAFVFVVPLFTRPQPSANSQHPVISAPIPRFLQGPCPTGCHQLLPPIACSSSVRALDCESGHVTPEGYSWLEGAKVFMGTISSFYLESSSQQSGSIGLGCPLL